MLVVTKELLDLNPNLIFVFGDNLKRVGRGGAAILRDHPQSYGFITKKAPTHNDQDYYKPEEYRIVFLEECAKLRQEMVKSLDRTFIVSAVGAGLANKFGIFEQVIKPNFKKLFPSIGNVIYLW